jgi:hypothetical protein
MYLTPFVLCDSEPNSLGDLRPSSGFLAAFQAQTNQLPLYEHHNRHGGAAVRKKQAQVLYVSGSMLEFADFSNFPPRGSAHNHRHQSELT